MVRAKPKSHSRSALSAGLTEHRSRNQEPPSGRSTARPGKHKHNGCHGKKQKHDYDSLCMSVHVYIIKEKFDNLRPQKGKGWRDGISVQSLVLRFHVTAKLLRWMWRRQGVYFAVLYILHSLDSEIKLYVWWSNIHGSVCRKSESSTNNSQRF